MPSATSKQARYWILTIKESSWQPHLPNGVDYIKGQLEQGQEGGEQGYRHWQLVAYFKTKVRMGAVKKAFTNDTHCEPCRSEAAEGYVDKEDTRVEGTQFCFGQKALQRNSKEFWQEQLKFAQEGKIAQCEPDVQIRYYTTLKKIAFDNQIAPTNLDAVCGIWIFGPPGVGKSHSAREWYPNLFVKNHNKWWDGYSDQKQVLIDDVDHSDAKWIGNFLKIWADKYAFQAETKGGTLTIRPEKLIVTSNYSIIDLFFADHALLEAITRRFYLINIPNKRF
jgi:hypothetical protein